MKYSVTLKLTQLENGQVAVEFEADCVPAQIVGDMLGTLPGDAVHIANNLAEKLSPHDRAELLSAFARRMGDTPISQHYLSMDKR